MSGWGSIYTNTVYALQTQSAALARLQEQISTGMRVVRASDDTGSAVKIMDLRRKSASLDTYLTNIGQTSRTLENSLNAMQQTATSLTRVRVLLTQASSGTYSDANRASMAEEVDSLLEQALSLANTSHLGQYSFSGQNISTAPYVAQRVGGRITDVQYAGSLEQMRVPVAPGTTITSQLVGDDIFQVPGSGDLFGTLINIRDLLSNTQDLESNRQQELLRQAGTDLTTVTDNLTQKLAAVGSRIQALDSMTQTLETNRNLAGDQADTLQNADIVNVATQLARSQNLYEMTLASAAKLLSLSLLDFIR